MTWFEDVAPEVRLKVATNSEPGLRRAQLGAAWALGAAFMSGRPTAAMAVLPTGTGKSAVLGLVPLLVPTDRPVLLAAPNRLVRDQLATAMRSQEVLRRVGAVPDTAPNPKVHVVEHRLATPDDWIEAARDADIVIGTMGVLSPSYSEVAEPPRGLFRMALVDEAHHVPATTWAALLDALPSTHRALVTATPVRSDGQEIQAELVYSYALADALRDGVIAPVQFKPVIPKAGQGRDEALAEAAVGRLHDPEHVAGRSLLIVRAGSITEAEALVDVYKAAGAELAVVTGRTTPRQLKGILAQLDANRLDGLASVGVLGEGFDYPRLKVAVYHRKHQTLGSTLQFAGRVSRTAAGLGPAELLAVPGEDIAAETRQLYESDSDWSRILAGLADAAVQDERDRRQFLDSLGDLRVRPVLPEPLSLAALRPAKEVQVIRITASDAAGIDLGAARISELRGEVVMDRLTEDHRMRVIVSASESRPAWISSDALDVREHELFVIVKDSIEPLLYVHAPSDSAARLLVDTLGFRDFVTEETGWIARFLNGLDVLSYFSVGMRATRLPGGTLATYRTLAGTSVGTAVSATDSIAYAAGHLILQANDPFRDGTVSAAVGVSMGRAKVWNSGRTDLNGFYRWCNEVGRLGRTATGDPLAAPQLGLRIPQTLREFPQNPLAVNVDSRMLYTAAAVELGTRRIPLVEIELTPERISATSVEVTGRAGADLVLRAALDTAGSLNPLPDDPGLLCYLDGAHIGVPLHLALEERSSLTVYYADASSSSGNRLYTPPTAHLAFPPELLVQADWTKVDIHRESKPGRNGKKNVQEAMAAWHTDAGTGDPRARVLNDDGAGEIADLVVISFPSSWRDQNGAVITPFADLPLDTIRVTLSHLKWAGGDKPRRDLRDIDQLVGQAHRSVRWLANPRAFWETLASRSTGRAKTLVGDADEVRQVLRHLAANPPSTEFCIQIVQPGLDSARVPGWDAGETLLSFLVDAAGTVGARVSVVGA
ncbi:DEAD/DEAH box helicase family protein [Kribbella sp. NPDC051770]|uniref:DEAD/DEAH box helicase family protein n=1 Tax=Kribbella sp. NPDC051770 TaxID=3155413 RepID=UPI00341BF170